MYQLCPDRSELSNELKIENYRIWKMPKCFLTSRCKYMNLNSSGVDKIWRSQFLQSWLGSLEFSWWHWKRLTPLDSSSTFVLHFSWNVFSSAFQLDFEASLPLCLSAPPPGIFKDISISNKFASVLTRTLFADSCILSPDLKRGAAPHNWNANDQPPAELQTNMKAIIY